jgi:hypothetical protein
VTIQRNSQPSKWKQWRAAIIGTFGLAGIWLAAIIATQPSVVPPPLPVVACGGNQWAFTNDYHTVISGVSITITNGFRCDLASIPAQAQDLLGVYRDSPAIRRGAACHDWLYRTKRYPRETADWLLYQACLEDGMNADKAKAVYEAVKLWGWKAWDRQAVSSPPRCAGFVL